MVISFEEVLDANMPPPSRELPSRTRTNTVRHAVRKAGELVIMVRDESREAIGEYLDEMSPQMLYATIVALAAMVPDDAPQADLLSWLDELGDDGQLQLAMLVAVAS